MTRLSSYYEHLVQPGRSVLGKRNYFGPKVCELTDSSLCDSDHFIGRITNPMCAPNTQSVQRNVVVRFGVDVFVASPIIFCAF